MTDPSGNILIGGSFSGTLDFDPGAGTTSLTSSGVTDGFVVKLSPLGNLLWVGLFGGSNGTATVKDLAVDATGAFYVYGEYTGTVDVNPLSGQGFNAVSLGSTDLFMTKMSSSNGYVITGTIRGTGIEKAAGIAVDATGNILMNGQFEGTVDFAPSGGQTMNATSNGAQDIFVVQWASSTAGNWVKNVGNASNETCTGISVGPNNQVASCGSFSGSFDLDPNAGNIPVASNGGQDFFALTLSSTGTTVGGWSLGGSSNDVARSVDFTSDGNLMVVGSFSGSTNFNIIGSDFRNSAGGKDAFLTKYSPAGTYFWARTFGGANEDEILDVNIDASGNIYVGGFFSGTVDVNPGAPVYNLTSASANADIMFSKFDVNGTFKWAEKVGSTGIDIGRSLVLNSTGELFLTGEFTGSVDFNFETGGAVLTTASSSNPYLLKIGECLMTTSTMSASACDSYTSPSGRILSISGTYQDTIPNNGGCDSVITINLAISYSSSGTVSLSGCDMIQSPSGNFVITSTGVYSDTIPNAAGCDSVLTVFATVNGATSGQMSANACGPYLSPSGNQTWTSSGTYTDTLTNANGCDSILTVTLTINSVDVNTTSSGPTVTASATNATFQWLDCGNNFTAISGETNSTYTAQVSGSYAVAVTQNGCTDTSACVQVIVIGVKDPVIGQVSVAPNPSAGHFAVTLSEVYPSLTYQVTDLAGRVLSKGSAPNRRHFEVDLNAPAGVYFLIVQAEGFAAKQVRLVKQ